MDTISMLVFIAVIVLSVMISKRYNLLFGSFSFFALATIIYFVSFLGQKISFIKIPMKYDELIWWTVTYIYTPFVEILKKIPLKPLSNNDSFVHYLVIMGIWIVLWQISGVTRRSKKRREIRRIQALKQGTRER